MKEVYSLTDKLCQILKANYYMNGSTLDYDFIIEPGRKYLKVVMVSNQRSVHAFVDAENGDLYKAKSWKAPAKGVRFNLFNDMAKLESIGKASRGMWAGGYLYR